MKTSLLLIGLAVPVVLTAQPPPQRPVSLGRIVPNIVDDQSKIWLFPAKLNRKRNWLPAAAILGTTAALIALDSHDAPYFRKTSAFAGFNSVFTGNAMAIGTLVAPVSLYATGLISKDSKMTETALLAGEAVADSEILSFVLLSFVLLSFVLLSFVLLSFVLLSFVLLSFVLLSFVLKDAFNRARPASIQPTGNFSDSWFESHGSFISGRGGMPSGHTIAAFSVATVVARRYGNHKWFPYVSYGLAALVGFSRLTLSAHFVSDVFVGGALGYSVSRFAVLRQ